MTWHAFTSTFLPSGASLLGGYSIAALVNRRAANKEAEAASKQARTADWEGFSGRLVARLDAVEQRLDVAEAAAAKYRIAVTYIRQIGEWVAERLPGRNMPKPPPELEADL
jgi:hypothetical protein